jgi:NTP pyrophosphatase (non-canonical NTP hydrolase)
LPEWYNLIIVNRNNTLFGESMISEGLKKNILDFRKRRDWEKFHKPKELAVSLVLEAAELLEHFQWKTDHEVSEMLQGKARKAIEEEIADIGMYMTYLCHDLGIDIEKIMTDKLAVNKKKYPADKVRGSARKYNKYL